MAQKRLDPQHPRAALISTKIGKADAQKIIELARSAGTTRSAFIRSAVAAEIARRAGAEGNGDGKAARADT